MIAAHIARDVCAPVAHRQFVFTIPKRLRIFFRYDRRLLGELPRLAWQTVLEVSRAVLDRRDVTPGMIAAIHTFGQVLHFHPHLPALVSDGASAPDGTFIPLPALDREPFEKLWQPKVFDLLLKRGKINESLVTQM
ncbi:MAG: transposase, partial [Planctomycetota bacterium]